MASAKIIESKMADAKISENNDRSMSIFEIAFNIQYLLAKKIDSILAPVKFADALRTNSEYLSTEIPNTLWMKIFKNGSTASGSSEEGQSDDTPPESGPDQVSDQTCIEKLSLDELIIVCQSLPTLKSKLDKTALDQMLATFHEIHIEFLITPDTSSSKERENRYRSIRSNLDQSLNECGLDEHIENAPDGVPEFSHDRLGYAEILKKIDHSISDQKYSEIERAKLKKIIEEGRSKFKNQDSQSTRSSVMTAIQKCLTCGNCQKMIKEARTLPCLHVFCSGCLKSIFNEHSINAANGNAGDKQVITCPSCHTRISMPSIDHVDRLPIGFVADALLKIHAAINARNLECKFCIRSPINACILCRDFYCADHTANFYKHIDPDDADPRPTHSDMIVSFIAFAKIDTITSLLYGYCPQHRQKLSHFCTGCKVPLCPHMLCVDWHSQHVDPSPGLRPIDDLIRDERQRLAVIDHLLSKKAEKINAKIDLVEKNQITVADVQENIRQSIEKYFQDIMEKLATHKAAFMSDLDKAAAQCFQNDETIHSRLQMWKEKTDKLESVYNQYTENGGSVPELCSLKFRILQQISDTCSGSLVACAKRLSYPETRLRELQHQIGTLQSNIAAASAGRGWESVIKFTQGYTPSAIGVPAHFIIDQHRNISYVIKNRGLMASAQVLAYDLKQMDNRSPNTVCDAGSHSFESLSIDSNTRRLFVAEQTQSILQLPGIRLKKQIPVRVYEMNTIGTCTLSRTVCLDQLNTYTKSLIKYAPDRLYVCDGVCVCEYEAEEFKLSRKFNFHNILDIADFAVEPKRDYIYVVDAKKHCLLVFNCQHQSVKSIGDQGVTPGRFDQPSAVALDDYGHLFVADAGNFRVQIFDMEGKFLRMVQYPQAVKEIAQSAITVSDQRTGAVSSNAKIALQTVDDCLYMCDSRSEQLWRYRYM